MSTVNEALKSLILALGGDPESMYDNTTISDYIKDLETAMQEGGSGVKIDDTTASDSTVYSSSKTESLIQEIPDPEPFVVTIQYDYESEKFLADKTYSEITDALANNAIVLLNYNSVYSDPLDLASFSNVPLAAKFSDYVFTYDNVYSNTVDHYQIKITSDDSVTVTKFAPSQLVVNFTYNTSRSAFTADKSESDISSALNRGQTVVASWTNAEGSGISLASMSNIPLVSSSSSGYTFGTTYIGDGEVFTLSFIVGSGPSDAYVYQASLALAETT